MSGLWLPSDVRDVVLYLGEREQAQCYFAGWRERPRRLAPPDLCEALGDVASFDVFFSMHDVKFPSELRDCWKHLPVIHLPSPTQMNYRTGKGTLFLLRWADEYLVDGHVAQQEEQLLDLARRLRSWLSICFVSERGDRTFDNRSEYQRLKDGW